MFNAVVANRVDTFVSSSFSSFSCSFSISSLSLSMYCLTSTSKNTTHGLAPIPKMKRLPEGKVNAGGAAGGGGAAGAGAGGAGGGAGGGGGGSSDKSGTTISTRSSNKRLLKEYRRLQKASPPGIVATPNSDNILEWHYVLYMDKGHYRGGQYHGILTFPMEYPMRPP